MRVGTACATNPIPLFVPCHRVVRSDGTIGQYRGGVEAKRTLLALESAMKVDREALDELGVASRRPRPVRTADCRRLVELLRRRRALPLDGRHGPVPLRPGQYRYFTYPLPELVAELRAAFWPHLLPIAREWAERLGRPAPWPDDLDDWLEQCHAAGQTSTDAADAALRAGRLERAAP